MGKQVPRQSAGGFEVMFDVPEGDRLGFVDLHHGGVQVMVETRA